MEKFIVTTGKTIELAIEAALLQLKLDRDSVSVEVIRNARSGFLGIGASPAEVKVTYEAPDEPAAPKTALSSASRSGKKKETVVPATTGVISRPGKKIEPEKKPERKPQEKKPAEPKPESEGAPNKPRRRRRPRGNRPKDGQTQPPKAE